VNVRSVENQVSGVVVQTSGVDRAGARIRVTQPAFPFPDPAAAYRLTVSEPTAQAMAVLARVRTGASAVPSGALAGTLLTSLSASTTAATLAIADAAQSALGTGTSLADNASPAAAAEPLALVQTSPDSGAASGTGASDPAAQEAADAAQAAETGRADQAARIAEDSRSAANAASVASLAALNALYAFSAARAVTADLPSQATDATAKFMGAGTLALPDRSMGATLAAPNVIPAVNGVLPASGMALNTSGNPQDQAYGGATEARQRPLVPALNPTETFRLDLTS